jgi:hypothetical protein
MRAGTWFPNLVPACQSRRTTPLTDENVCSTIHVMASHGGDVKNDGDDADVAVFALEIQPETLQQKQAAEFVIATLKKLALIGLNRNCQLQIDCQNRSVQIRVRDVYVQGATLPHVT